MCLSIASVGRGDLSGGIVSTRLSAPRHFSTLQMFGGNMTATEEGCRGSPHLHMCGYEFHASAASGPSCLGGNTTQTPAAEQAGTSLFSFRFPMPLDPWNANSPRGHHHPRQRDSAAVSHGDRGGWDLQRLHCRGIEGVTGAIRFPTVNPAGLL